MSVVIPGSDIAKKRAEVESHREMHNSIRGLDRTFSTGAQFHWKIPPKEERDRVDKLMKDRDAKRAQQLAQAKAKHYKRTSFVWTSEKYPATEGPWDQPLISGFGLTSPCAVKPFGALFKRALDAGLTVQPNAGEEWRHGEPCFNILDAIEHGAKRIGHGIHALATPSTGLPDQVSIRLASYGVSSMAELMKREEVTVEVCLISNRMVESTQCERYGTEPLRAFVRAGVPVVLGSDHSGMWSDGEATNMHEQVALAVEMGLKRPEVAEIMVRSFELTRAVPEAVKPRLIQQARKWAQSSDPIQALPKADMHANLDGMIPLWWLKAQADAQGVKCPVPKEEDEAKWRDLDEFREVYDARTAIIRNAGLDSIPSQILAIAASCEQRHVRVLELSITPWGKHLDFFRMCSAGRTLAYERHGVFISFVVTVGCTLDALADGEKLLDSSIEFNRLWSSSLDAEIDEY